ncbi:MAG: DUF4126 domain-containing protein [Pseudomonadota bacterium]
MDAPATLGIVEILGIATSVSLLSGWRMYLVVLATGIAMRTGYVPLPEHLESLAILANPWIMGVVDRIRDFLPRRRRQGRPPILILARRDRCLKQELLTSLHGSFRANAPR